MAEGSTGTYTGAKSGLVMRGDKPQRSHAFVMLWAANSFWAVQGTIIQVGVAPCCSCYESSFGAHCMLPAIAVRLDGFGPR
jgi:hypothetical protein